MAEADGGYLHKADSRDASIVVKEFQRVKNTGFIPRGTPDFFKWKR